MTIELVVWPTRCGRRDPNGVYMRSGSYRTFHILRRLGKLGVGERVECGIKTPRKSSYVPAKFEAVVDTVHVAAWSPYLIGSAWPVCRRCKKGLKRRGVEWPAGRSVTITLL